MKQIKIFYANDTLDLEEKVNNFLKDPDIELVDIKELEPEDQSGDRWYKLMVIFTIKNAA